MEKNKSHVWLEAFEKEADSIQSEFDAFFINKNIKDFYSVRLDEESGYLIIDIKSRDKLPPSIIDRLTVAYLRSKPK